MALLGGTLDSAARNGMEGSGSFVRIHAHHSS
jgi:hypothetical protein